MNKQSTSAPKVTRPEALTLAWQIVKDAKLPFVKAQAQAWATLKLKAQMQQDSVSFFYRKEDGSERFAVGHRLTAQEYTITATGKPTGPLVVRYFDTLAGGWRSFRADRLIIC